MSLLLVLQATVIYFVLGKSQVRPSHPTDGVTEFHVAFLSLDRYQNDSRLNIFLTKGKRVFHMSILSLMRSENSFASSCLFYGQASTYRPPSYVLHYCFGICLSVCTYDISTDFGHDRAVSKIDLRQWPKNRDLYRFMSISSCRDRQHQNA